VKLKIKSLNKKHYVDRDELMLHACFQILQDYIEKEKGDTHCDYKANKEFVDEIRFLNKWWKKRKKPKYSDDDAQDDEMLLRLMKIRLQLWT